MSRSPAVILYDASGNPLAVQDGVAIPANTPRILIAGNEGGTARTLRTSSDGTVRMDPTGTTTQPISATALPLPTGAATEATLTGVATETTLGTRATEATLATRASETTLASRASEATLALVATEATLLTRATEATLATRGSETTLSAVDAKLATIDAVLDSIKDTDGIKKITDSLPAGTNIVGKAVLSDGTSDLHHQIDSALPGTVQALPILGQDASGTARLLKTEDDGTLRVASSPPSPPPGTSEFVLAVDESNLSISTTDNKDSAIIGNGITLFLQTVVAGAGGDPNEKGSKVEVYWVENGTEHLITRNYIAGQSVSTTLPDTSKSRDGTTMVGDGSTTFLRVRRVRLSNQLQEVDFGVRGYTQ